MHNKLQHKKTLAVAVMFLFIGIMIAQSILVHNITASDDNSIDTMVFNSLENISVDDDAFHNSSRFFHIESWYFDVMFEQNYSIAFIVTVFQKDNRGSVLCGLYLYKNTTLVVQQRKNFSFSQLSASEERPLLVLGNTTIIDGLINKTGLWTYHISWELDSQGVDLQFVNITKGWKSDIRGGWWLAIPNLRVSGNILLNGETIPVTGEGYHDHNWFRLCTPFIQKGWHFINIPGETIDITYVQVMKTQFKGEVLAVWNQNEKTPLLIPADDVNLTVTEYMFDHGRWIPKNLLLQINNEQVQADITLQTYNVHYVKLPFLKYWRYHLKITGTIITGSLTETIDTVQISELIKFY